MVLEQRIITILDTSLIQWNELTPFSPRVGRLMDLNRFDYSLVISIEGVVSGVQMDPVHILYVPQVAGDTQAL